MRKKVSVWREIDKKMGGDLDVRTWVTPAPQGWRVVVSTPAGVSRPVFVADPLGQFWRRAEVADG